RAQRASLPKRGEFRLPQDLVAVRVANARHELAVAQQRLQLSWMASNSLPEGIEGQRGVIGVGPHLRPARNRIELVGPNQVQLAEHLAVDVAELTAIGKSQA